MASKLDSPIQAQLVFVVFNGICNGEYHGCKRAKLGRTRHVFVQIETGCVLGLELDRNDNAHTVKKGYNLPLMSLQMRSL